VNNRRAERIGGATVVELPYSIPVGAPFQKLFGPSRTTQHELIQQGEIESALVGDRRGRRVILTQSYLDYLKRQQQKEAAGDIGTPSPNPRARERSATPRPRGKAAQRAPRRPRRGRALKSADEIAGALGSTRLAVEDQNQPTENPYVPSRRSRSG
jgi:hypothetical protein